MRKLLMIAALLFTGYLAKAQQGYTYIGVRGGWVANDAYTGTINLDFSSKYFSSYELFGEVYDKSKSDYRSYMAGVVYKPTLTRNKNSLLRFRAGVGIGSGNDKFIAAPQLGLEFAQAIMNNVDLLFVNRNQVVFFDPKNTRWRVALEVGFRFPL
ncbi:hypothetical protein N180_19785 [Pedobacter antarcticus 4BY]|uniref:Outer membrane protein beta-barrel domain-containing protein n=2 Tax=Pedobacter antarcticus TaxID=34086 RepID=A0A081PDN6_9SPHI|nr:hypothetical protein [Pedobacter antarcticus]KEQ28809.1 hypothetical protein N180_19785 [Pedobacter antarcticus 4BY]SFF42890.1 hypothetical protein SAMN03003324_03813 [Pedobacter antarcticus]